MHLCVINYIEFSVSIPDPTIGCNVKSLSEFLVEHLEKEEDLLRTVLRHKNKIGRTVFHLAALCPQEFHDYLWEYADQLEIFELIDPDIVGNTILHYLVVTQQIKCFAQCNMNLPLNHRRQLLITMRNGQSGKTETGLTCIFNCQKLDHKKKM